MALNFVLMRVEKRVQIAQKSQGTVARCAPHVLRVTGVRSDELDQKRNAPLSIFALTFGMVPPGSTSTTSLHLQL